MPTDTGAGGSLAASGGGDAGGSNAGGTSSGGAAASGGAASASGAAAGSGGSGGELGVAGSSWGGCDEFVPPADCSVPEGAVLPGELRCTGLYADWQSRELRCGVATFAPAHTLWSDGAEKQRYVWLPPGEAIDVSDPNDWVYPVGTRFWKEFYVGPEGAQKLGETRFLLKSSAGWLYTAYVWSEDGATALQVNDGVEDLFGSGHSVPTRDQCKTCHGSRPDYVLGWDFVMLAAGASGITARQLADDGVLSDFDPALLSLAVPGDEVEQAALGYLHANCGVSCHNQTSLATGKPSGLFLRLEVLEMDSVHATDAATSGINRLPSPNANFVDLTPPAAGFFDFRPLDSERSLALARMSYRGSVTAMPPIGTHQVHPEGVAAVTAWVESMTTARGYPAPSP